MVQLISFARALLENPAILILDEATSSIDTETEILLQKGLNRLLEGRTSFIIAHRLSTIKNANCIIADSLGGGDDLLVRRGQISVTYVIHNGAGEDKAVLHHDAHLLAQGF